MLTRIVQFVAVLLVAIAMAAGWAHLLELPNKIALSRDDYLTVQQIYRGWALLGFIVIGALVSTAALAWLQRGSGAAFLFALAAAGCVALSLVVFFSFTFPANQATANWTVLPAGWEALRRDWEYSHAAGAILYFVALASLVASLIPAGSPDAGTAPTSAWLTPWAYSCPTMSSDTHGCRPSAPSPNIMYCPP